jgi:hypothetical protein
MTFCGLARDTVLTNRQTEKLNFDTNYITISFVYTVLCRQDLATACEYHIYFITYDLLPIYLHLAQIEAFPFGDFGTNVQT